MASASVASKVKGYIEDGDFYGALQVYRTSVSRCMKKQDYASAEQIAIDGTLLLLKEKEVAAATDLALTLFPLYKDTKRDFDDEMKQEILRINNAYPHSEGAAAHQTKFLKAALEFSIQYGEYRFGHPEINLCLAECMTRPDNPGQDACNSYFLHSHQPEKFARFMFQTAITTGYESELELFLIRPVLQLLAVENLKDANTYYTKFVSLCQQNSKPTDAPLFNFARFALKTVERDAYPLFKMLGNKYGPALNRDPNLNKYMDQISERVFGVKKQKVGLAAMMDSMMGMFNAPPQGK